MLIVCPFCATRYSGHPNRIGADGREPRCPACGEGGRPDRARAGRGAGAGRIAAGAAGAIAIALVAGAVTGRGRIAELSPRTAALFAAVGLPIEAGALQFRGVSAQRTGSGAESVLVVEGDIVNPSSGDRAVPLLEISVQGDRGEPFYTWTSTPPRQTLPGTETTRFRARLAAPPAEGRRVLVRFAAMGGDAAAGEAR
jgi:predicted Zn finger-like uncharacterized protein